MKQGWTGNRPEKLNVSVLEEPRSGDVPRRNGYLSLQHGSFIPNSKSPETSPLFAVTGATIVGSRMCFLGELEQLQPSRAGRPTSMQASSSQSTPTTPTPASRPRPLPSRSPPFPRPKPVDLECTRLLPFPWTCMFVSSPEYSRARRSRRRWLRLSLTRAPPSLTHALVPTHVCSAATPLPSSDADFFSEPQLSQVSASRS